MRIIMKPLRIALIGAGLIGKHHINLIKANPDCQLAGICDVDPEREILAVRVGTRFYSDLETLCKQELPDGAIIATPNEYHSAAAEICASFNVPMLIEKPLAASVSQAKRILEFTSAANVPVLVGHHRRHNPLVQKAREVVREGDIGQLVSVSVMWLLHKPADYFEQGQWRTEPEGGGPVLINLIHDIDNLRYICGDIDQVFAFSSSANRGFAVEDTAAFTFRFQQGALGSGIVSDVVSAPWSYELASGENPAYPHTGQDCYYFCGTQGSLAFPSMTLWHYPHPQAAGWYEPLERRRLEVKASDPLAAQLAHFCQVIRGEDEPLVSALEGLRTLITTLAVRKSALSQRPVVIEPV